MSIYEYSRSAKRVLRKLARVTPIERLGSKRKSNMATVC